MRDGREKNGRVQLCNFFCHGPDTFLNEYRIGVAPAALGQLNAVVRPKPFEQPVSTTVRIFPAQNANWRQTKILDDFGLERPSVHLIFVLIVYFLAY